MLAVQPFAGECCSDHRGVAVTISPVRVRAAGYTMTSADESLAMDIARSAGERLDDDHWLLTGGTRSLAGQLGRLLERRVFAAEYGAHEPSMMTAEYGAFEERSIHAVILDANGMVAAARTIWSPDPSLPTKLEHDLGLHGGELRLFHDLAGRYGSEGISELATAVVEPRARGGIVTGWLLGEMRRQQMGLNPESPSCAMIDLPFNRMIRIWGHEMGKACGREPTEYLGHLCQPTFFEPGPQRQIRQSRLFSALSDGWLQRVERPLSSADAIAITEESLIA